MFNKESYSTHHYQKRINVRNKYELRFDLIQGEAGMTGDANSTNSRDAQTDASPWGPAPRQLFETQPTGYTTRLCYQSPFRFFFLITQIFLAPALI